MANSFRSDALNLIGCYSDGCDSDSSDDNESVTPAVKVNTMNSSSVSVEEPGEQQSDKTSGGHVGVSDMIMQDEVPHVGMDYTIDSDPPDESTCAQIQLIESQVDCGGNDAIHANASNPPTGEQKWTEKTSMKSNYNANGVPNPDGSDHTVETTVEILSDHDMQLEANECQETLDDAIQKTPTLKEKNSCNEDERSMINTSAISETNSHSSEYVYTPEAQPKAEPDDQLNHNQPASASTLCGGSNSHQQLAVVSREESSQHRGYYGDEHGYDQQYYNQEQQYEYQQYYDQHQYYEEHVPQHKKEQYDSTTEHQQEYVQVQAEIGTSIQDGQQWHVQSDHHQYMHPDHHQHSQREQQLYPMSDQNPYTNQPEYSMSEQHHSQPEQQQYSQPESEQWQQYPQPERQQYSQCEQQHFPQPEQQQYSQPEQQHFQQPEQQQHYPQPEQQQYSQPEQQHFPQPEQQQHYPQPEQQQYSQSEQQHFPQLEQQQHYPQPEQQQYSQPEQQHQYPQPEQQQQYVLPEQQQHYAQPEEQQQYSKPEQQQQYPPFEQQQYSQTEQQHCPQPEQQQQYSQHEQQQYPQTDQQYYMQQYYTYPQYSHSNQLAQQHCAQPYPQQPDHQQPYPQQPDHQQQPYLQQPDQQQQPYPQQPDHQQQQPYPQQQQQQQQQPDSRLQRTEHSVVHHLQPDQQQHASSEQQHGRPQGEYSHTYHEAYAQQQQYGDEHHNRTHGQHSQSYDHQYYDQYGHGSYHSGSHDRAHEQSTHYSYPSREGHDTSFDYSQAAEHAVDRSGEADYQPYPPHHHNDPHPQPFSPFDFNQREQGRRGSDHERLYPRHGDWEDHRPYNQKWGDNCYSIREQQSNRLPSHPVYGSPASDTWRDSMHSPVKRDVAGHLSDPRLDLDVRNSPQRNYRTSGELSDPRRKQRDTKERGTECEEKHYTKSAKYTKISSTVVSRRPAMLKASNISKASKVKSTGPQIIEPHFASTSPPKTRVCEKGDKSKAPGKLPEATTAKKALANFKIPKHKSSKLSSESTTVNFKPAVKIPALDIPEKSKKECAAEESPCESPCNIAKINASTEKDIADCQSKSAVKPAQGKEIKAAKLPMKSMKVLPNDAPTKVLSNLDATTLQALTTIVHQTLKMAANKGMPVAKSITSEMSQLSEITSGHSGEMQSVTTITPTTATTAAAPSVTTTAVPSTSTVSSQSTGSTEASSSTVLSSITATSTMVSSASQVLDLQNVPAPTVSVALAATVQEQLASSPVSSAEASSLTPVKMVSLSAPQAEQAAGISNQRQISTVNGAEKPDSAVSSGTMTYILPKAKTTATSMPGTKSAPRKTSGVVLATILSAQIKGKSAIVPTAGVSNPSMLDRVVIPHTVSSYPSVNATVQTTANTDSTLPASVANSVMAEKPTPSTSKEADHSSKQSVKKTDIDTYDAQAGSKKANIVRKSPPRLEYFNADLMFKEYNLRQSGGTASRDGSPFKRLQESIRNHGSSCENSKPSKRERPLQSDMSSVLKKVKVEITKGSQENGNASVCNHDLPSENVTKNAMRNTKGRSNPPLRRKTSVQRKKSRSHRRPQLHGMETVMSEEHTCEDLLCAFCHQRGGAMNLGFLYGPYKFDSVSIANIDPIDANKESTGDYQGELWVHEDCAVWAPGVCLVGDHLIGLQEAVADGDNMLPFMHELQMCEACKRSGATLCCTAHGCKAAYHYPCAQETGCALKEEQFLICCSKHRGTMQS